MQAEVVSVLWPYVLKALVGLAITGIGALMIYPVKYARREWKSIKEAIASTHAELVQQRENCLTTLQTQGDSQISLLTKMSDTLEKIHLSQAEMTGFCKANSLAAAICKPRLRKKN